MMGYLNYSVEDFLADESFQRHCSGTDEAAIQYWNQALKAHPEIEERFTEAVEWYNLLSAGQVNLKEETNRLTARIEKEEEVADVPATVTPFLKTWWAAAAILLLVSAGSFYLLNKKKNQAIAVQTDMIKKPQGDIAPGGDKAILTLADGSQIVLDTTDNGDVTKQGGVTIIKLNGQLAYNKGNNHSDQVLYNSITTPKGGQYQLILADGTKVWLNAASSLRFPTAFAGKERIVDLTGEGYFEVAHNAAMPFHVKVGDMDVQVLGTHFNVMAYNNEELVKTTLLEGKVKVRKAAAITMLFPGQQAQVNNNGEIKLDKNADVEAAIAWKNGLFQLKGADVKTIGRQIERWYDVEVSYSGNLQSAHLSGEVPRNLNLSQVIKVLEASGIEVKLAGRSMLVTPKP